MGGVANSGRPLPASSTNGCGPTADTWRRSCGRAFGRRDTACRYLYIPDLGPPLRQAARYGFIERYQKSLPDFACTPGWGYAGFPAEQWLPLLRRCSPVSAPMDQIDSKREYLRTGRFAAGSPTEEPLRRPTISAECCVDTESVVPRQGHCRLPPVRDRQPGYGETIPWQPPG